MRNRAGAQFDERQFLVRLAILAVIAAAAALVPTAGDRGPLIAAFLVVVVLPLHLVIRRVVGRPNPAGPLDLLAVVAATVIAAIDPDLWQPALVFQMLNIGGAVAFLPARWTLVLSVVSGGSMTAVAWAHGVDGAVNMLVIAAVFLPALIAGAHQRNSRERRSTERVNALADSMPLLIWETRGSGIDVASVVGRAEAVVGLSIRELRGFGLHELVIDEDRERRERAVRAGEGSIDYRVRVHGGEIVWLRDHLHRSHIGSREVVRGITLDISALRAQQDRLHRQDAIVRRMSALVLVVEGPSPDLASRVMQVHDNIGWLSEQPGGEETLGEMLPEIARHADLAVALAELGETTPSIEVEHLKITDRSGNPRHVEIELFCLPDEAVAILVEDVTEREQAMERVRYQARHDQLTGLRNRTELMTTVDDWIEAGRDVTLLLIDLDNFKDVNDALGHYTGDELLRVLSLRLTHAVRADDLVTRLGGDEFAVAVPDAEPAEVDILVGRILSRLRASVVVEGATLAPSASIGVARAPLRAQDAESLLRCADVAMYEAKRSRSGSWHYGPSMATDPQRLQLSAELREGFALGEIVVHLQPVVALDSGRISGAEVLVRWQHPSRGILAPQEFLDLVQVAGLDGQLVSTVLAAGVSAAARLPDDVSVAMNISAADLRRPELSGLLGRLLIEYGVSAERIELELTESEILDDSGVVQATLESLSTLGIGIAIDDFGTGYSSFARLRELPLSRLKIDRRFVSGMVDHEPDDVIVRSMVDLAENMGLRTTAEGVESEEQQHRLAALGCEHGQGFLYGRPMPVQEFVEVVETERTTP
ncbi:MAG: EAL domain-containing protein [Actinomycetota bacterium]